MTMTSRSNTDDVAITGTPDAHFNLISVIYHALQGSETYEKYVKDAERSGDRELSRFLRDVQQENRRRAERAKELLYERLNHDLGAHNGQDDRVAPAPPSSRQGQPVAVAGTGNQSQGVEFVPASAAAAAAPPPPPAPAPQRALDAESPTYERGYAAGADARYASRSFEEVEPELRRAYETEAPAGDPWDRLREEVREGFRRAREGRPAGA
jgi:hypothetical protein